MGVRCKVFYPPLILNLLTNLQGWVSALGGLPVMTYPQYAATLVVLLDAMLTCIYIVTT